MKKALTAFIVLALINVCAVAQAVDSSVKNADAKMKLLPAKPGFGSLKLLELPKSLSNNSPAEKNKTGIIKSQLVEKPQSLAPGTPVILKKEGNSDKSYKNSNTPAVPVKTDSTTDIRDKKNKKVKGK
jgi:hypothetical protein